MTDTLRADKPLYAGLGGSRGPRTRLTGYPVNVGPDPYVADERARLAALVWDEFDLRPVSPSIGAEIGGVDLTTDLPEPVIAGDTVPCDGLDRLCAGADVYVQTVLRDDLVQGVPSPRLQDVLDYHSTCEDAGRTAAKAGVGTLVLTHPVPAPFPGTEDEWVERARGAFTGDVVLAHDLWSITLD